MFKKRYIKKEDKDAIIDMDDFLITYGAQVLGVKNPQLAQIIYKACKPNLKGLDNLFHDQGFGRIHKFTDIAYGYVSDMYDLHGAEAEPKVQEVIRRAVAYLGAHANAFDKWKLA